MKRILQLLLLLVVCTTASAQTETAKKLYAQANADKSKIGQFLKQDFSAVDSTSMHDLAVMSIETRIIALQEHAGRWRSEKLRSTARHTNRSLMLFHLPTWN